MLLSTISLDDIRNEKGVHESRNALIARILREKGFMRELGEGMMRIFSLFKKNELAMPDLFSENDNFIIKLRHKSVYNTEQKLWLDQFKDDDLSLDEKSVVLFGYGGNVFSAQDIWDAVGIVDTEDYRVLVYTLQTKGILAAKYGNATQAKKFARKSKTPFRKFKRYYIIKPELRGHARSEIEKDSGSIDIEYEKQRIYITNIPYEIKEPDLYELFDLVGNVDDICIPLNYETGQPRGFAFVAFDNKEDAEKAIEKFNGTMLGRRKIAVSFAYKRGTSCNIISEKSP